MDIFLLAPLPAAGLFLHPGPADVNTRILPTVSLTANKTGTTVLTYYLNSVFFAEVWIEPRTLLGHARQSLYHRVSFPTHDEINA